MFRNIISPVQAWLLSRGQCVACGMPLKKGKKENRNKGIQKITCKCGRIFVYNQKTKKYRRALLEEV